MIKVITQIKQTSSIFHLRHVEDLDLIMYSKRRMNEAKKKKMKKKRNIRAKKMTKKTRKIA